MFPVHWIGTPRSANLALAAPEVLARRLRQSEGSAVEIARSVEIGDIQPGPAYALYVVPGADRRDHRGGIRIDALRGNEGTLHYDIPDGVAVADGQWTVLVWCEIFDVPVTNATPI